MQPGRWQRITDVFFGAADVPPDKRAAYLAAECADDVELRRDVEALMAHDAAPGFLLDAADWTPPSLSVGDRIGAYAVQRLIGLGGMGAVYLCARADDQYQQQVAVKLLQRDLATPALIRRFRAERQILASVDHPYVAHLLDGGVSADGQLFLVMEYVAGEPIDQYCDRSHLSTSERIDVFRRVCEAVQAAHRALIVHRDIKPSNILVQADGAPKLLDFGIAKVLTPASVFQDVERTGTGVRLMTTDYASPEQIRGGHITTATDIYSLGVVLYRLLVGVHPQRVPGQSIPALERAICEDDPHPPSQVTTGRIDPDLRAIVMKALRKEPSERYASVEQLHVDLHRYQRGYPVLARRGTTTYHVLKFLRRNRAASAAAALLVLSLVGGIAATSWLASVARAERSEAQAQRELAERRFAEVKALASSFLFEFDEAIADLSGATSARRLVVRKALDYLSALAKDARNDVELQRELAIAYQRVGDIQGYPMAANLGDRAGALNSYQQALSIWAALADQGHQHADAQAQVAMLHRSIGDVLSEERKHPESLAEYRTALAMVEGLPTRALFEPSLFGRIGTALAGLGQSAEASTWLDRAVKDGQTLVKDGADREATHDLAILYGRAGRVLSRNGAIDQALVMHEEELALSESLAASAAPDKNAHFRRDLAVAYHNVAAMLSKKDQVRPALAMDEQARQIQESLLSLDPANAQVRNELGITLSSVSELLVRAGDLVGAERARSRDLQISERLLHDDAASAQYRIGYGYSLFQMGELLRKQQRLAEARQYYLQQADTLEAVNDSNLPARRQLVNCYRALSAIEGDRRAAASYAAKADELARQLANQGAKPAVAHE